MTHRALPVLLLSLIACDAVQDVPDAVDEETLTIAEASLQLFREFDGDEADLVKATLDLESEVAANVADTTLAADPGDRGFELPPLGGEDLGGKPQPPGTVPEDQLSILLVGTSIHDYDANVGLALETNQVCIESNTTFWYGRTFTSDEDAFEAGGTTLTTTNEVRKENFLAKAWYDLFKDYRRIDLGDGREALVAISWTEEVFEGDNGRTSFDQNFTAEVWIPQGETTLHAYAIWTEISLGVSNDILEGLVRDGLDEGFRHADAFLSGEDPADYCEDPDRDRAYDRPDAQ